MFDNYTILKKKAIQIYLAQILKYHQIVGWVQSVYTSIKYLVVFPAFFIATKEYFCHLQSEIFQNSGDFFYLAFLTYFFI